MDTDRTKLRDKRLAEENAPKPMTRPNQNNTKYSQRFTEEAVKPDNAFAPAPVTPEPRSPENPSDENVSAPAERDMRTADNPSTKTNQHNTKYSQRFVPEAAKAENKPVPAATTPEKTDINERKNSKLKFSHEEKDGIKSEKDALKAKAKKKQTKLQHDAATASEKLEKAQTKAGKTGAGSQRRSSGKFGQQIRMAGAAAIHRKIGEAENENSGVQSAHSAEYASEKLYGASRSAGSSAYRFARESPLRKAAKLEEKSLRANMKLDLHKVQAVI
jgi:hypothetical protein